MKLLRLTFAVFLVLFTACEDAPPEKITTEQKTAPVQKLAQNNKTSASSENAALKQSLSFDESPETAMAKVKAMLGFKTKSSDESRAVIGELPSAPFDSASSSSTNSVVVTPPPEIKKALETAKNNKAISDVVNSVFQDLPTAQTEPSINSTSPGPLLTKEETSQLTAGSRKRGSRGSLNAGIRVPNKNTSANGSAKLSGNFDFDPEDQTAPEDTDTKALIKGNRPRGYLMLSLMQPQARQTIELQIQNLIDASIENVFLGVLTDGTFDRDFNYLQQILTRLNSAGRRITLSLYITNGATMRSFDTSPITAGFSKIEPKKFRDLILNDSDTQTKFKKLTQDVAPIFLQNKSLSPFNRNIAIVMLEDNLTKTSYLAMRKIAAEVLGDLVTFVRNPCPGCYDGNDSDAAGDAIEFHGESVFSQIKQGDAFTFDGAQFLYPSEAEIGTPFSTASNLIKQAEDRGVSYVGLWRADWQGLSLGAQVHPINRPYHVPTLRELESDQELLRSGLDPN